MSAIHLEGMGVALVTPFRKDKAVDFEALDRLLDFHLEMVPITLWHLALQLKRPRFPNRRNLKS